MPSDCTVSKCGFCCLSFCSAGRLGSSAIPSPLTSTAGSPQRDAGPEDALEDEPQAIDDCLRKEACCGTELDYAKQTS